MFMVVIATNWKNLPTEKEKAKENTQDATTWNKPLKTTKKLPTGSTTVNRTTGTAGTTGTTNSGFAIFEDESFQKE